MREIIKKINKIKLFKRIIPSLLKRFIKIFKKNSIIIRHENVLLNLNLNNPIDRDIQKYYKSIGDIKGKKTLNDKLKKTCYNYKPDLIVTGHADLISKDQIQELKEDNPNTKFAQWFLDPLNKNGPDFERNKDRILDKIDVMDGSFLTTSPTALNFLPKNDKNYYIPNPSDYSLKL